MISFYKLRMEATKETIAKHGLYFEVKPSLVLLSCLYDIIFHKVIYNRYGYIVYMRNSYFNIGIESMTILKSFTTKNKRNLGLYYKMRKRIKSKVLLDVKEGDGKEPTVLGYIKSV